MDKKYTKAEVEARLRYLFELYHQVRKNIDTGSCMGAKGSLHPNLTLLLQELKHLKRISKARITKKR